MTISYAITVCDEHKELERLLDQIYPKLKEGDQIVILIDENKRSPEVMEVASKYWNNSSDSVVVLKKPFSGDFAEHKNSLRDECKGDYVVYVDADEYFSDPLIDNIHEIVENNPLDLFLVPRKNTVEGLTDEHVKMWGWRSDDQNRVNWPDFQMRIIANKPNIKWQGRVHERMTGYASLSQFPMDNEDWCLIHPKTIERQEKQNNLYSKL